MNTPNLIYRFIVTAMAAARLGRQLEAKQAVESILSADPKYAEHVIADLEKRCLHPDLIEAVIEGLGAAGMQIEKKVKLSLSERNCN